MLYIYILEAILRLCVDIANKLSSTNFSISENNRQPFQEEVKRLNTCFPYMYCTLQQHLPSGLKRTVYENTQISKAAVGAYEFVHPLKAFY